MGGRARHDAVGRLPDGVIVRQDLLLADEVAVEVGHNEVVRILFAVLLDGGQIDSALERMEPHPQLEMPGLDPSLARDPEHVPAGHLQRFVLGAKAKDVLSRIDDRLQHGLQHKIARIAIASEHAIAELDLFDRDGTDNPSFMPNAMRF